MTVELCGAPRQLPGWHMHVSSAFEPLPTLRADAKKLLVTSKRACDVHISDKQLNN